MEKDCKQDYGTIGVRDWFGHVGLQEGSTGHLER